MKREIWDYTRENKKYKMTVYTNGSNTDKCIVFISGSFQLTMHAYIKKVLYDLYCCHRNLFHEYECIVMEQLDEPSITTYKDVAMYIRERYKERQWKEIVLLGFSAGGVVASHIAHDIRDLACLKKIITYDTPYEIMNTVARFQRNWFYRLDCLFFLIAYCVYLDHWNYQEIQDKMRHFTYGCATELFEMVQRIHSINEAELYRLSTFHMDQEETTKMIHIYVENDPIVYKDTYIYDETKKDKRKIHIKKGTIGHCSDMAWSRRYLLELVEELRL